MANLIDKDALVAEIKRRKETVSDPILSGNDLMIGERNAYFNLLSFIDSMQEEPTIPDIVDEHFDEMLDEEPVSENLEEAAKHYLYSNILYDDVYVGNPTDKDCIEMFKAGAKWQKQQTKKEAVDGLVVCNDLTHGYKDIAMHIPDNLEVGDKVKLIIIKEG